MTHCNPSSGKTGMDIDFTDMKLTGNGGLVFLGELFERMGLRRRPASVPAIKSRRCGASDVEMLPGLTASLAAGGGALSDVDALGCDAAARELPGLREVPGSRRLGEFRSRFVARRAVRGGGTGSRGGRP